MSVRAHALQKLVALGGKLADLETLSTSQLLRLVQVAARG